MSVGSSKVLSGIHKAPVKGRVQMGRWNLSGDGQADLESHGGVDKAVYPHDHYAFWESELGRRDLQPGAFRENFTAEGMTDDAVELGDVYRVARGQTVEKVRGEFGRFSWAGSRR
jgi:MOSC domain-containing protein YiiM